MKTHITAIRVFKDPFLGTRHIRLRGYIAPDWFPFWVNIHINYPDGRKPRIGPTPTLPGGSWQSLPMLVPIEGVYEFIAQCSLIPPHLFEIPLGPPDTIRVDTIGREDKDFVPIEEG